MIARMIWWESEIVLCKLEQSTEVEDVLFVSGWCALDIVDECWCQHQSDCEHNIMYGMQASGPSSARDDL